MNKTLNLYKAYGLLMKKALEETPILTEQQKSYFKTYFNYLKKFGFKTKPKRNVVYTEGHHMLPKCFKKNNFVLFIPAKYHYYCHKWLTKMFPENDKIWSAWICMAFVKSENTKKRYKISAEDFELAKIKHSELATKQLKGNQHVKGKNIHTEEWKKEQKERTAEMFKDTVCVNNSLINKMIKKDSLQSYLKQGWVKGRITSYTEEQRRELSIRITGEKNPMFGRTGEKNPMYGVHLIPWNKDKKGERVWINNSVVGKLVEKEELEDYLNNGWIKGMMSSEEIKTKKRKAFACYLHAKGKIWVNNRAKNKLIEPEELKTHLSEGWERGMTNETGNKISKSLKDSFKSRESIRDKEGRFLKINN
jgi:hypothetical protein